MWNPNFELPKTKEEIIGLISAIPSTWNSISGNLYATREMYESGDIAEFTRVKFSKYSDHGNISGSDDLPFEDAHERIKSDVKPKAYEYFLERKFPSSIEFDRFGMDSILSFDEGRRMLNGYILLGYKGQLIFSRRDADEEAIDTFSMSHVDNIISAREEYEFLKNRLKRLPDPVPLADMVDLTDKLLKLGIDRKRVSELLISGDKEKINAIIEAGVDIDALR